MQTIEIFCECAPTIDLDRLVAFAPSALARTGFVLDARGVDWAHWVRRDDRDAQVAARCFQHALTRSRGLSFATTGDGADEAARTLVEHLVTNEACQLWPPVTDDPA